MRFNQEELFDIPESTFKYRGPSMDHIVNNGATEFTLCVIGVDKSGSVDKFEEQLREMMVNAAAATKSSPRSENVLLRTLLFSDDSISEVHGFMPASEIDPDGYPGIHAYGGTPLYKATFSAVASMVDYGRKLSEQNIPVNGIAYIITDGEDTQKGVTPEEIMEKLEELKSIRGFDSLTTILIGVTSPNPDGVSESEGDQLKRMRTMRFLKDFHERAGFTHFIDMGSATVATLAKMANFVSSSLIIKSSHVGTDKDKNDMSDFMQNFNTDTEI